MIFVEIVKKRDVPDVVWRRHWCTIQHKGMIVTADMGN